LRAYRDRHRSSMMKRASEAFALISRGAYSELKRFPADLNRRDSQRVKDERVFVH
jgi:uncharacterized protein YhaN